MKRLLAVTIMIAMTGCSTAQYPNFTDRFHWQPGHTILGNDPTSINTTVQTPQGTYTVRGNHSSGYQIYNIQSGPRGRR